jgi:osmotically-inducible protein OsmY
MKAAEVMITNVITVVDKALAQLQAEASLINVIVQDGTVELWGIVDSASEKKTVRVAAEVTLEVRAVNDYLIIRPAQAGY